MKIGIISTIVSVMSIISFVVYCCLVVGAEEDKRMEILQKDLNPEEIEEDYC